jgi:SAM-dependent methyltransferase
MDSPYGAIATHYDEVIGRAFLPGLCSAFESLVHRYRIRFRSAADVGCGTGLFARWLHDRWRVPVVGVDLSPDMLAIAHSRARPGVVFLCQDMRRLRLPYSVDLITSNFDTFNHLLSIRDVRRALAACYRALASGGHLIFDAITPALCRQAGVPLQRSTGRGSRVMQSVECCSRQGLVRIGLSYQRRNDSAPIRVRNLERAYPSDVLLSALCNAGFRPLGIHNATGATRGPPARVMIVAKRASGFTGPQ